MQGIQMDVAKIVDSVNKLNAVKKEIDAVRQGVRGTTKYLDSRICQKRDIGKRLEELQKRLSKASDKAEEISDAVLVSVENYRRAEREAGRKMEGF